MPTQTNWEPHVSVIYDLTGNGSDRARAGYNRYVNGARRRRSPPARSGRETPRLRPKWKDVNGDGIAQYQVTHDAQGHLISACGGSPGTTGFAYKTGCELDFSAVSTTYGQTVINNVQDPNLKRPFQDKINVGISHELMKGVSVSFEWFRTANKDSSQTWNITRLQACGGLTPAAGMSVGDMQSLVSCNQGLSMAQLAANPQFQLINVFSPLDGHVVPVYDTVSSTVSALSANNFVTTDPDQTSIYNGFDVGFNARLPKGGRMFGGTTTERTTGNNCDTAIQSPSNLLYCDSANLGGGFSIPWKTQVKMSVTYPLSFWGLSVNAAYQVCPATASAYPHTVTKARRATRAAPVRRPRPVASRRARRPRARWWLRRQ
jgi:hypothetical protein